MQTVNSHYIFLQRGKNREHSIMRSPLSQENKQQTAHSQRDKLGIGWPRAREEWGRKNLSIFSPSGSPIRP